MEINFLYPDDVAHFEKQYGNHARGRNEVDCAAEIDGYPLCGYGIVEEGKRLLIGPSVFGAPTLIELIPRFLAWGKADSFMDMINALDYQVCQIRLRQALDEIGKMDSKIAAAMRDSLEDLSRWAAVRFTIAPATRQRLVLLHKDPATHVAALCQALKAELRLSGRELAGEGCWTALGDFYLIDKPGNFLDPRLDNWSADSNLRAPRLHQIVPVDGASPNLREIDSATFPYGLHNVEEFAVLAAVLENTMGIVESIAPTAGQMIKRFVKVIVTPKAAKGTPGSSSHYNSPGQIVLRNSQVLSQAAIATALVHEAIHQILYVLESGKRFVDSKAFSGRTTVASAWTGTQLPIHSYLHACFVWYGLARFWRHALRSTLFPADSAQAQFNEALRGFRAGNPIDRLLPYSDMICPEAMQSVASLWDELRRAGELEGQPSVVRDSRRTGAEAVAPVATSVH